MKKKIVLFLCITLIMALSMQVFAISSVPVKGLKLDKTKITLEVGSSYKLQVKLTPSNTTQRLLKYSTSNKKVAIVDTSGKITAVASGKAVITVTSSSNSKATAKFTITVTKPVPYTVSWYLVYPNPLPDTDAVLAKANEYLLNKLNMKLDVRFLDWGNYKTKMNVAYASDEEFDLVWNADWMNFTEMASKRAYLNIKDMLPKYMPDYYKMVPKGYWEALTINNKIYSVPNMQNSSNQFGIWIRNDVLEKVKYDKSKIKTLNDVDAFYTEVLKADPSYVPILTRPDDSLIINYLFNTVPWFQLGDISSPGAAAVDSKGKIKVINQYTTGEFEKAVNVMHKWVEEGKVNKDWILNPTEDVRKKFARKWVSYMYNAEPNQLMTTIKKQDPETLTWSEDGVMWSFIPLQGAKKYLSSAGMRATMTCVSATSKEPAKALQFLNLFNTDKELYNMFTLGIEGKHYVKLPNNRYDWAPGVDPAKRKFDLPTWEVGNTFLAYYHKDTPDQFAKWIDTWDKDAIATPVTGFSFDPEPVKDELAKCSAVYNEMKVGLFCGIGDPTKLLPEFISKMKAAGADKIIAEKQKQIDEWIKNKK